MAVGTKSNVFINFITEFKGAALTKGQKQMAAFDRQLKGFAKTFIGVYSAQRLAAYSKASYAAYSQDLKAQMALENQLKNVGMAYQNIGAEQFIAKLQQESGILDDYIRPAYANLIRVTKSYSETQKAIQLAWDTSGATGQDFTSVVNAITQAYQGNTKGLKALNLGLTATQLKTMSIADIFDLMGKKFEGAGEKTVTAADRMKVVFADISESVGKSISKGFDTKNAVTNVNALKQAADDLAPVITGLAKGVSYFALGLSAMATGAKWVKDRVTGTDKVAFQESIITKELYKQNIININRIQADQKAAKQAAAVAEAERRKTAQAQAKSLALAKLQKFLQTASRVFDQEAITLAAAAQNKLTEEEKARLKLKTDLYNLEQAINDENVSAATQIAESVAADMRLLYDMRGAMVGLGDVKDPFAEWYKTLQQILADLGKMTLPLATGLTGQISSAYNGNIPGYGNYGVVAGQNGVYGPTAVANPYAYDFGGNAIGSEIGGFSNYLGGSTVNISIEPSVAGLINVIQDASASGVSSSVNRINTSYIA